MNVSKINNKADVENLRELEDKFERNLKIINRDFLIFRKKMESRKNSPD